MTDVTVVPLADGGLVGEASLLARSGRGDVAVPAGGPDDRAVATGENRVAV